MKQALKLTVLAGLMVVLFLQETGKFSYDALVNFGVRESQFVNQNTADRRRLITFNPVVDRGNSSWIENRTVHGAILQTCHFLKTHSHLRHSGPLSHFHNCGKSKAESIEIGQFPIPFVSWPIVNGRSCPIPLMQHHNSKSSGMISQVEKGYGLSHLQIWLEFVFFDHDLLLARLRTPPEYLGSTTWSSVSGTFHSYSNGTLTKNGVPFQEDDFLVVIEEDSLTRLNISTVNLNTLEKELSVLNLNEILLLRSCGHPVRNSKHDNTITSSHSESNETLSDSMMHHRLLSSSALSSQSIHGNNHICFSSYATTRHVIRKLSDMYDVCGRGFDQQMNHILSSLNFSIVLSNSNLFNS